jgi:hypothetical protein
MERERKEERCNTTMSFFEIWGKKKELLGWRHVAPQGSLIL